MSAAWHEYAALVAAERVGDLEAVVAECRALAAAERRARRARGVPPWWDGGGNDDIRAAADWFVASVFGPLSLLRRESMTVALVAWAIQRRGALRRDRRGGPRNAG
jgi:hypothetical protein